MPKSEVEMDIRLKTSLARVWKECKVLKNTVCDHLQHCEYWHHPRATKLWFAQPPGMINEAEV